MDAKYLAEIKVREQSATPGEWKIGISSLITDGKGAALFAGKGAKGNADFIAHARTDVPALIAEIELIDEERTVSKMEIATLKKVLEEELADLTTVGSTDEKENYTTGYRNGHRNGRIELIKQILKISDGAVKQEEKDNAK